MLFSANYRWLAAILSAALVLRIAAAVVWQQQLPSAEAFALPDSESYWELGRGIARQENFEFSGARAFRTPGYPLVLAPLFWICGDHPPVVAARLVGAVFGTLAVGGVAWLSAKLFGLRAMLIAAACAAVYIETIAMSVLVLSEALFAPLMVAQLLLWTSAWQARQRQTGWWCALGAGVCAGLGTLARPSWLLFTPLAIGLSFAFTRPVKSTAVLSAIVLASLVLTMSPWWIRNYVVLHAFVPTSSETGPSLYDGLHAGATGASNMRFVPHIAAQFDHAHPVITRDPAKREVALNRYFAAQAIAWARANPRRVIKLAMIKLARMWNIWPNEASMRSWPLRLAVATGYVPLLVLGLIGGWRFARRDFPYALCLLPAAYFSLLHMIFIGSIRYRQPAMLLLIVLAAGAVDWLFTLRKEPPPAPP